MDNDLRVKLRDLIEMWGEVSYMNNLDRSTMRDGAIRRDCMNDLEEILNGDYSCIERTDS